MRRPLVVLSHHRSSRDLMADIVNHHLVPVSLDLVDMDHLLELLHQAILPKDIAHSPVILLNNSNRNNNNNNCTQAQAAMAMDRHSRMDMAGHRRILQEEPQGIRRLARILRHRAGTSDVTGIRLAF